MADDWLAGMAGGGECGGMPAQSWCVAPLGSRPTGAHAVLLCKEFFSGPGPVVYLRQ
jgi:hypothetical protein